MRFNSYKELHEYCMKHDISVSYKGQLDNINYPIMIEIYITNIGKQKSIKKIIEV